MLSSGLGHGCLLDASEAFLESGKRASQAAWAPCLQAITSAPYPFGG